MNQHQDDEAISAAAACGHDSTIKLLVEYGVKIGTESVGRRFCRFNGYGCATLCFSSKILILNLFQGYKALWKAAVGGHESTVMLLLDLGVEANAPPEVSTFFSVDNQE